MTEYAGETDMVKGDEWKRRVKDGGWQKEGSFTERMVSTSPEGQCPTQEGQRCRSKERKQNDLG